MIDPLNYFSRIYPFDGNTIARYEYGFCYVFIMLKNGRIGVCATLNNPPANIDPYTLTPDMNNVHHRMIYNAWLNATINCDSDGEADIFDVIPFDKYENNVMVGFFRPVVQRFDKAGTPVRVFDHAVEDARLELMDSLPEAITNAEQIIVTSTTIFNGTFFKVLSLNKNNAPVFMLGPSTILHEDMFKYPGLKALFGMLFDNNDNRIGDIIANGGGTRDFNTFAAKIYRRK